MLSMLTRFGELLPFQQVKISLQGAYLVQVWNNGQGYYYRKERVKSEPREKGRSTTMRVFIAGQLGELVVRVRDSSLRPCAESQGPKPGVQFLT